MDSQTNRSKFIEPCLKVRVQHWDDVINFKFAPKSAVKKNHHNISLLKLFCSWRKIKNNKDMSVTDFEKMKT